MSLGYDIPGDIAIAGFDGTDFAASPVMRLTTVDQHVDEIGRRAVKLLLKQLSDPGPFVPFREVLPCRLLLRGSTEGGALTSIAKNGPYPLKRPLSAGAGSERV